MSVSSISSSVAQTVAKPAPVSQTARAVDGDYKTKGVGHEVKDADGDYKPSSPAAKSSSATLAALSTLTKGG